jgi:LmbE family N-acetylglucosaminyl deacetylase
MTTYRPPIVSFPKSERDRLIELANNYSLDMIGMDRAAGQEYARRAAARVNVVIAIYPDPDAHPDHDGLSFAVIKGFRLFEEAVGTNAQLEIMALALTDEQQAVIAEQDFGDDRPPLDRTPHPHGSPDTKRDKLRAKAETANWFARKSQVSSRPGERCSPATAKSFATGPTGEFAVTCHPGTARE